MITPIRTLALASLLFLTACPDDGSQVTAWKAHEGDAQTLAFHPSAALLASGGRDGRVRLSARLTLIVDSRGASAGENPRTFLRGQLVNR